MCNEHVSDNNANIEHENPVTVITPEELHNDCADEADVHPDWINHANDNIFAGVEVEDTADETFENEVLHLLQNLDADDKSNI